MNKIKKFLLTLVILCICCSLLLADSPLDVRLTSEQTYQPETESISSEQSSKGEKTYTSEEKETSIEGIIKVNTSLRLREYPWGPVIGNYTNNTKCTILGEEGEFYKVSINGKIGYLHKNYVSTNSKPASRKEPSYPGNCKNGGFIARTNTSNSNNSTATPSSNNSKSNNTNYLSANRKPSFTSSNNDSALTTINVSNLPVKESVIGKTQGDGTAAGAVTWAKDQMAGGTQMGYNRNNKKISRDETCWNHWCAAFISSAWGRTIPQMNAKDAYAQYKNFKRDGMIHTDKNPPPGAIMFTGPTATSEHGHVFMATGEVTANGEPMVITSGWTGHNGISTMPLSKMIGTKNYLGWAMPN